MYVYISAPWSFYLTIYLGDFSTSRPANLPIKKKSLISRGILWEHTLI